LSSAAQGAGQASVPSAHGAEAARLAHLVHVAFVQGMSDTLTVFALIAAAGVVAALFIRRRDFVGARPQPVAEEAPAPSATPRATGAVSGALRP
jgi:hypothetical protein